MRPTGGPGTKTAERPIVWVSLTDPSASRPVKVCVAVQPVDSAESPWALVVLRDHPEALIVLGAVLDAGQRVQAHLEIWLQRVDLLQAPRLGERQRPTNGDLEVRWGRMVESFREMDPDGLWITGWETEPLGPKWLCPNSGQAVPVVDGHGAGWSLCRDPDLLRQVGESGYDGSRTRWLVREGSSDPDGMVEVGRRPVAELARVLAPGGAPEPGALLLNPEAGKMFFRRHRPLLLEDYVGLLNRGELGPAARARLGLVQGGPTGSLRTILDSPLDSLILSGAPRGSSSYLLECLYLKLSLFVGLLQETNQRVAGVGAPLLNLTPESFQVGLGTTAGLVPLLWTACPLLTALPESLPVEIPGSELRYFVRTAPARPSAFQPSLPGVQRGECEVNLHGLDHRPDGQVLLEATLEFADPPTFGGDDICKLSLALGEGDRLEVFGHLRRDDPDVDSSIRFVSVPQTIEASHVAQLPSDGGYLPRTLFELVPQVGLSWDFYSLGVLAVWMFLGGSRQKVQESVVALKKLADPANRTGKPGPSAETREAAIRRIEQALTGNNTLGEKLGAHNLIDQSLRPDPGSHSVPLSFWAEVLEAMMILFPGCLEGSVYPRLGGGGVDEAEAKFQAPVDRFRELARRARSLIMVDWQANAEINRVIAEELGRQR